MSVWSMYGIGTAIVGEFSTMRQLTNYKQYTLDVMQVVLKFLKFRIRHSDVELHDQEVNLEF